MLVLGDLISKNDKDLTRFALSEERGSLLKNFKGLFYIILINNANGESHIYNSLFSMLPVYYLHSDDIYVSSNTESLHQSGKTSHKMDKKYLLEQYLFNYPFLHSTLFREIKLLPSNSCLKLDHKGFSINKIFEVESLFCNNPVPWRKSLEKLSSLFIEKFEYYYPDEPFWIAFTGGFDGRTLVSAALQEKKNFSTFAFGRPENPDLAIPQQNAATLGIPFKPVYLDDPRYIQNYYEFARETAVKSDGDLSLLYSHFLHTGRELGIEKQFMLTGYCGSEILRAPRMTGTVISQAMKFLASDADPSEWVAALWDSFNRLRYINHDLFRQEFDELVEELIEFRIRRFASTDLTENQRLYILLLEESFRKFFGNWIKVQSPYVQVRVPYMDFEIISALFKTGLAGVNNRYYTNNPIFRFKGQLLYSRIIEKTSPSIFRFKTVKGYSPQDLTRISGYANISVNYFRKKIRKKINKPVIDNLSIITGFYENRHRFPMSDSSDLFNINALQENLASFNNETNGKSRDETVMALSQLVYLHHLKEKRVL